MSERENLNSPGTATEGGATTSTPTVSSSRRELNEEVLESLQAALKRDPEMDLHRFLPRDYEDRYLEFVVLHKPEDEPQTFRARIFENADSAVIMYPLSDEATSFLAGFLKRDNLDQNVTQSLFPILIHMISESEVLWESLIRGVVLKCNDSLAVKIIRGNSDYTEYTSMQYLAKHAPNIPVPRPHGLVKLVGFDAQVIFMTYIPSTTLENVWSILTPSNKIAIQLQLDAIFTQLRRLKKDQEGLGGVAEEGAKIDYGWAHNNQKSIATSAQFEDFHFPKLGGMSASWSQFIRSFLPRPTEEYAFTHGDVRTANIMVKLNDTAEVNDESRYIVSGIIDWEDSGFYPEYYESTKILATFDVRSEDDWYAYLPASISPARYPVHWLVNRLWDFMLKC